MIEVHNLDKGGASREVVDEKMIAETINLIAAAGRSLKTSSLPKKKIWEDRCNQCELSGLCRTENGAKKPENI